jgi:hypothetical protein
MAQENNNATIEYVTPSNITDGHINGNDIICRSIWIVMLYNKIGIVGSIVFYWGCPKAISRGPKGPASRKRRRKGNPVPRGIFGPQCSLGI